MKPDKLLRLIDELAIAEANLASARAAVSAAHRAAESAYDEKKRAYFALCNYKKNNGESK